MSIRKGGTPGPQNRTKEEWLLSAMDYPHPHRWHPQGMEVGILVLWRFLEDRIMIGLHCMGTQTTLN